MTNIQVTEEKVRCEIKRLLAELTERDDAEITDTASLTDDLGVDSLMAIEVMVALDKKYNIDIPDAEFNTVKNVNEAVETVMRYLPDHVPNQ